MLGVAGFDVSRTGDGGAWIDQVGRIEHARAILALIAPGPVIAAMRAGADNVAIRQKAAVIDRVNLACDAFLEKTILIELMVEMLCDLVVLRRVRAAERIRGEAETVAEVLLQRVHPGAVFRDRQACLMSG